MPIRMSMAALVALLTLLAPLPALAGSPAPAKSKRAPASAPTTPSARTPAGATAPSASSDGAAQSPSKPVAGRIAKERVTKDDGYSYAFGDDPLQGAGYDAAAARIAVRRGHVRGLLIRPRIQFVDAMLKSVENI
jgi:hypothetical protein